MARSPVGNQESGQSVNFPEADDDRYDFLFKVVLIGDAGVGKTCAVQRFKHGIYVERHGNTIGVDFMLRNIEVDGKQLKLQIWDTAGQERFRTITQSYYRGSHGVIVAYDITNADSFSHVSHWVDDVKRYAGPDVVMVLMGTKLDLVKETPADRQVATNEAKGMATSKHMIDAIETSSKEDTNIAKTFKKLAKALKQKYEGLKAMDDHEESVHLATQSVNEQQTGCKC